MPRRRGGVPRAHLGPAGIDGPYAVFGPDGALKGIYRDAGASARPEVVLASDDGDARKGDVCKHAVMPEVQNTNERRSTRRSAA